LTDGQNIGSNTRQNALQVTVKNGCKEVGLLARYTAPCCGELPPRTAVRTGSLLSAEFIRGGGVRSRRLAIHGYQGYPERRRVEHQSKQSGGNLRGGGVREQQWKEPIDSPARWRFTSSSFGRVTAQANTPRQVQFGLKLVW
jgi:hypothetical protein